MADQQQAAPTITYPTEGQKVESQYYAIRGAAPAGSTVYYMEYMKGFGEKDDPTAPETKRWQWPIRTTAKGDNTFDFPKLVGGTGQGDWKTHKVFVNVGGTPKDRDSMEILGGTESNTVTFTHEPKEKQNA